MEDQLTVIVLAIALATVPFASVASANHFSVGVADAPAASADETPDDPSVEGPSTGGPTPYEVGTSTDCTEIDEDELNARQAEKAASSDGFCNELVYHNGTSLEQVSPPDQQFNGPIGTWDVFRHNYNGVFAAFCEPFCREDPGGDLAFRTVHRIGSTAGVMDGPEEADDQSGQRYNTYGHNLVYPTASTVVQQQTDAWRMNGWTNPTLVELFVGILKDDQGNAIGPDRLADIVAQHSDKFASDRSIAATVCGFTPDHEIAIGAADTGFCEIDFFWRSDGDSTTDGGYFDSYQDPCESPTYVCGASGDYWASVPVCIAMYPCTDSGDGPTVPGTPVTDPVETPPRADAEYTRYHWIVAPTQSACTGAQEPGAAFDNPGTAEWNFLAHDLDVYTPPTSISAIDGTEGVENTQEYAYAQAEVPNLPATPENPAKQTTSNVDKPERVEPNAKTSAFTLQEDSQSITIDRSIGEGTCASITGAGETEHTVDPWVNYVDMDTVEREVNTEDTHNLAAYLNEDPGQDDTNQPTQSFVYTEGQVGMFTDKQDTGSYDQADNNELFSDITDVGAYPLFYDMRLNDNAQPAPSNGCSLGFSHVTLVENMVNAGYGARTGLVQAVYLEEPSALFDSSTGETVPLPGGQTIVVLESQALYQLRHANDATVTSFVDGIVDGLRSHPSIADDANVAYANDLLDVENAFGPQCQADTGGFDTEISFLHQCETGCTGDTIATGYMAELTRTDNTIGSATDGGIPYFQPGGDTYSFPDSQIAWVDVDPFDNDPDRNDDTNDRPPHHPPDEEPAERHHQSD